MLQAHLFPSSKTRKLFTFNNTSYTRMQSFPGTIYFPFSQLLSRGSILISYPYVLFSLGSS